jgi:hypothetical protein
VVVCGEVEVRGGLKCCCGMGMSCWGGTYRQRRARACGCEGECLGRVVVLRVEGRERISGAWGEPGHPRQVALGWGLSKETAR